MPLGSAVASVFVEIGADSSGLSKGFGQAEAKLGEAEQRLMQMGQGMQQAGGQMTRYLTLPLVAAGAAALKFAVDFDTSMSRIQGLVGLSASEVEAMRGSVLELAGETTRAPQELADALYFITSAGLRGQTALDALEVSAKAAAAGLGETEVVAGAITSAMNAYGHDVLSAAQATDILVATVRSGKVEAADLAPQIGRVADVASTLGITFAEVGGVMAYFTSTTGSAELAGTRLDGIMRKIVRPTQQFEEGLASVGLSADQLRTMVSEQGLVGTLQVLQERFGGNAQAVANLFEESTAVAGVLGILNDKTGSLSGILGDVEDSTGALDNAFGAFAESAGFEASQSFAEIQVALIAVGDALAPLAASVLGFVADFAGGFANLPGPVIALATALGVLLAAVGPVVWSVGKLQTAWVLFGQVLPGVQSMVVAFARGMSTMVASFAAANPHIAAAVAALAALGAAIAVAAGPGPGHVSNAFDDVADSLMEAARAAGDAEAGLAAFLGQNIDPAFASELTEIGVSIEDIVNAVSGDQAGFEAFISRLQGEGVNTNFLELLRRVFPEIQEGMEGLGGVGALDPFGPIAEGAAEAAEEVESLSDAIDEYLGNQFDVEEAKDALLASFDALGDSLIENGQAWRGSSEEARANRAAMRDIVTTHAEVIRAMEENGASQEAMGAYTDTTIAKLRGARDMGLLSASAFRRLRDDILGVPRMVHIGVSIGGVAGVLGALNDIYDAAIRAASAVGQTGGSLAGGGTYSGGGGYSGPPPGGVGGNRGRSNESGRIVLPGSGQRAVLSALRTVGAVDVAGGTGGEARQHVSERPIQVSVEVDGEVVGRTAALYLEGAID